MSAFSERCRQLLESNHYTIYQISKKSGLERTALHRMIAGRQLPAKEFFQQFCFALRLSANDTKDLTELYIQEKIGTHKYLNRKYIRETLQHMADMGGTFFPNQKMDATVNLTDIPRSSRGQVQTQVMISTLLSHAFVSSNTPVIFTNIPAYCHTFFDNLNFLFHYYHREVSLFHLFNFQSNPQFCKNANCNLEILFQILPLAFSNFQNYIPLYTYSQVCQEDFDFLPWPFYLVTDGFALEISQDMTASILHTNKAIVDSYRDRLEQLTKGMSPLIHITASPSEAISYYARNSSSSEQLAYALSSHPCLLYGMDSPDFHNFFTDFYGELADQIDAREKLEMVLADLSHNCPYSFFSERGLAYFCETGKVSGQLAAYFPPMDVSQRKKLLENFINSNSGNGPENYMIDRSFKIPWNMHLEVRTNSITMMRFLKNRTVNFCFIEEPGICEAFFDYFSALMESPLVYNLTKTNEIIGKLAAKM